MIIKDFYKDFREWVESIEYDKPVELYNRGYITIDEAIRLLHDMEKLKIEAYWRGAKNV